MKDQLLQSNRRESDRFRKQKRTLIFLVLFGIIILAVTSLANRWKRELRVERVSIRGCRILTEKEVITLAAISLGVPLYDVDLLKVRERLRTNAYIQDAVIAHDLPSTIKITIHERKPVAVLGGTDLFYIDEEGILLPPVSSKEVYDLPVITGLSHSGAMKPRMKVESENFRTAMEILIRAAGIEPTDTSDREVYHLISEINLSEADPTVYTAEQGIPILFAKENIDRQLVYLQSFWNQYMRQLGADQVSSIDLRFDGQVVVRWNKIATATKPS